jgi:hypothetical protein
MADKPGSSGVFKAIVMSARRFKRAITGTEEELTPEMEEIGNSIAQAFVAGRLDDVFALGTAAFQERTPREQFSARWSDTIRERGTLTGFEVSNFGAIDLAFIPGLEEVAQTELVAFLEIAFSTPTAPLDDEKAFVVGAVLLRDGGKIRIGALHTR